MIVDPPDGRFPPLTPAGQVARDRLDNAGANPIIGGPLTKVGKRADCHRGGWLRRRGDRDDQARPDDHRDCGPNAVANAWGHCWSSYERSLTGAPAALAALRPVVFREAKSGPISTSIKLFR